MAQLKKGFKENGSVLLLALWVLAFLGLVAASLSFRMGMALRLTQTQWEDIQLRQLAKMAVPIFCATWKGQKTSYTTLNQGWNSPPDRFKEYAVADGFFSIEKRQDESAKININVAPPEVLQRLCDARNDLISAILEWRTPAQTSAHQDSYERYGYESRHGVFQSIEELRLVRGMTPDIFKTLKDKITVYSFGPVNVNTASMEVLQALGMPDSLVQKIIFYRKGSDGQEGTPDDGYFPAVSEILTLLQSKVSITPVERDTLTMMANTNMLSVQSDSFRLQILTHLKESRLSGRYEVVMSARLHAGHILYWRELQG